MNQSLTEKLKTEIRSCPTCKFVIENPFVEKCPRCSTELQKLEVGCSSCTHKAQCSFSLHTKSNISRKKN